MQKIAKKIRNLFVKKVFLEIVDPIAILSNGPFMIGWKFEGKGRLTSVRKGGALS